MGHRSSHRETCSLPPIKVDKLTLFHVIYKLTREERMFAQREPLISHTLVVSCGIVCSSEHRGGDFAPRGL